MKDAFIGKEKEWSKVIAHAWLDEDFKKRLLDDPAETLKEYGIVFPEGTKVTMQERGEDEIHLTLPPKPADLQGSVEEIGERVQASGGQCVYSCNCI